MKTASIQANVGLSPIRRTKRCDGGPVGHEVPLHVELTPAFFCGKDGGIELLCERHNFNAKRLRRAREKVIARRGRAYWMLWAHRWMDRCDAPAEWHTRAGDCLRGRGLSIVESV